MGKISSFIARFVLVCCRTFRGFLGCFVVHRWEDEYLYLTVTHPGTSGCNCLTAETTL